MGQTQAGPVSVLGAVTIFWYSIKRTLGAGCIFTLILGGYIGISYIRYHADIGSKVAESGGQYNRWPDKQN